MSALADFYRAQIDEKNASIPLLNAQTRSAEAAADQIAPDAAARRADQFAAAGLATAQGKALTARTPSEIDQTAAQAALTGSRPATSPPTSRSISRARGSPISAPAWSFSPTAPPCSAACAGCSAT